MRKKKKKEPETVKQANWLCWIQAICYKLFSSFGFCYSVIECFLFVFSCFLPLLVKKKKKKTESLQDLKMRVCFCLCLKDEDGGGMVVNSLIMDSSPARLVLAFCLRGGILCGSQLAAVIVFSGPSTQHTLFFLILFLFLILIF